MPTDPQADQPTTAPASEPSPTINIVDPAQPQERPYTPPTLITDEELAALAARRMAESDRAARERQQTPTMITDGQVEITVEGDRIVPRRVGDTTPLNAPLPPQPAPMTPRALSKREAEMEAGRRAVARAEEARRLFPPAPKSAAEIAAEGSTNPVFRPGDFAEYRNMRAGNASKDSGSVLLQRTQRALPEG